MADAKFTPGPWFVGDDRAQDCPDHQDSGLALVDTGRSSDWPIARLCEWPNARLIAAAPDLFAALQQIAVGMGNLPLEQIGPDGVSGINDGKQRAIYLQAYVEIARTAIAKATLP